MKGWEPRLRQDRLPSRHVTAAYGLAGTGDRWNAARGLCGE